MDLPSDPAASSTDPITAETVSPVAVEKRPGIWSGLGIVGLYFLLQIGLAMMVGAVIAIVLALKAGIEAGRHHTKPDTHAIAHMLQNNPDLRVVLTVATMLLAAVVMCLLVRQFWPKQWSRAELPGFGFTPPTSKLWYVGAIVLAIVVLAAGALLTRLLAGHHPVNQDVAVMAGKVSFDLRVLLAVLVVCVAPVVEELVFRGVLLSGLARRMHVGWAILVSAIIFGCVHLPDFHFAWYPVPALVLVGLAAGALRVFTRSLWPSITLHATNNFIAVFTWFVVAHH